MNILLSIKQLLGIAASDLTFDAELMLHINAAIGVLTQLGVGPKEGFIVNNLLQRWDSLTLGRLDLEMIKTYVFLKVRLAFDPPQNSFLVKSIEDQIKELDWRIEVAVTQQV